MSNAKTILIVDDEPDAIEIVKAMLSEVGEFEILTANDGASGFDKAKEAHPDLIILDVQMPGRSGFFVFYDIRKEPTTKDIPVIMLTGIAELTGTHFSGEEMGDLMGEEPDAYLEKPVDALELQKAVSEQLGM